MDKLVHEIFTNQKILHLQDIFHSQTNPIQSHPSTKHYHIHGYQATKHTGTSFNGEHLPLTLINTSYVRLCEQF